MADGFDPYYSWLGIPPDEQPPNHYRLLGLRLFEDNVEAIQNAADRQMAYLRTFQTGRHSSLSQKLLNEIAAARVCLSNAPKKAAYDAALWQRMQPLPVAPSPPPASAPPTPDDRALTELFVSVQPSPTSSPAKPYPAGRSRQVRQNLWLLSLLACATLAVLVAVWLWRPASTTPPPPPATGENKPLPAPPSPATRLRVLWPEEERHEGRLVLDGWVHQLSGLKEGVFATHLEFDVDPGTHVVRLLRPGFDTWEETVVIEECQQGQITPRWQTVAAMSTIDQGTVERPAVSDSPSPPPSDVPGIEGKESPATTVRQSDEPPKPESGEMVVDQPTESPGPPEQPLPETAAQPSAKAPQPPEPVQKLPVPAEAAQTQALATVKQLFEKEYESTQASTRLGLAARLIRQARESREQPTEQYVMLCEARALAERQGDCAIALLAVDELAKRFEVSGAEMKRETLALSLRHARTSASVAMIAEAALRAGDASLADGQTETWSTLLNQLKGAATKKGGPPLVQMIDEGQKRLEALAALYQGEKAAAKALEADPADPAANLELGRFYCLAKADWDKGLPMVAKGAQGPLPPLAAKLVAQRGDVASQLAMADGWWSLAEKERSGMKALLAAAARYWYQQAQPRLAGADLARVQERLTNEPGARETRAKGAFVVPLHGLGGLPAMTPSKVTGSVAPGDGFAVLQGNSRMEYAQIPASAYVQHLEFTFAAPAGSLELRYGDPREGARLVFGWNNERKKFDCRLYKYSGNWSFWGGERTYDPQTRLQFTFYVSDSRHLLHEGDRGVLGCGGHPADLCLRLYTGNQTVVNIHRCEFRPWTPADAARLRWPMPPSKTETQWGETALRLYERNIGLRDKPILADKKPYIVASTGTAMEWIEPGKFQRPVGKEGKSTEITITRGFWISRYEITQGEWATLVPANPSRVTGSPFLPVDAVSYEEAVKYGVLLNQQESKPRRIPNGYVYRLPTEAEWEHACRAGSHDDFSVAPEGFWSVETSGWRPHEVGEGKPNAWGLYDMHGNLGEWCLDAWQDEPQNPVWRLTDPFSPPQKTTGDFPVRGGAWWAGRGDCASRAREQCRSVQGGHRGFRIVLAPSLQAGK